MDCQSVADVGSFQLSPVIVYVKVPIVLPPALSNVKTMLVKLLTLGLPSAGVIDTCLNRTCLFAVAVMLTACSYVNVAFGYALRLRLAEVLFVPGVNMPVESLPDVNVTGAAAMVIVEDACIA